MLTAHWAGDTARFLEKATPFTLDQIWGYQTAQIRGVIQQRVF